MKMRDQFEADMGRLAIKLSEAIDGQNLEDCAVAVSALICFTLRCSFGRGLQSNSLRFCHSRSAEARRKFQRTASSVKYLTVA